MWGDFAVFTAENGVPFVSVTHALTGEFLGWIDSDTGAATRVATFEETKIMLATALAK